MKKILESLLLLLSLCVSIFASESFQDIEDDEFLKEMLLSDIPITYGDESFRERILARTEGKRDPIGLILTGGSARACAHIGVLRYLDEHGIVPDFIVSNSMGSIIGMLYAAGISPNQIEDILRAGDISSYFSLTLPTKGGFLNTGGFKALINYVLGDDYRLEDTDIPIMVVCDDLVTKREIRITEGPFTDILVASFALPVYFDPYEYNGHLLVDGGIISLAPISAAYEYTDTVILSTTFYDADKMNLIDPVTILNSSFDLNKRQNVARDLKRYSDAIWIRCAVEQFSFMAFKDASIMADIGYESTEKEAEKLNALYKGQREISEERSQEISDRIEETRRNISTFGRLKASEFTTIFGLEFCNFDSYYLKNSFVTGLEYKILAGNLDFSTIVGLGSDTQNLRNTMGSTTLGAQVTFYPFYNTRIKAEAYFDFFRRDSGFSPQLFTREAIDSNLFSGDSGRFSLHQSLEYYKDYASNLGEGSLFSLLCKGGYNWDKISLGGDIGYFLTSSSVGFKDFKNYIQLTAKVDGNVIPSIYSSFDIRCRISVDGKGSVPAFITDGYVSRLTEYGATALITDSSLYNLFMNGRIDYVIPFDPTFGEFLIFENPKVGLYASSLIYKEGWGVNLGVELNSTCSLIGLIKIPLTIRIGYGFTKDKEGNGVTASIIFSSGF